MVVCVSCAVLSAADRVTADVLQNPALPPKPFVFDFYYFNLNTVLTNLISIQY